MNISFEFRWPSPLGISVILFLLFGLLNVLIGVLTPFLIRPDRLVTSNILLMSERTDTVLFGGSPSELVAQDKSLGLLRQLLLYWLAGLLLSFGVFQLAVTWFGLRQRQAWALWTLTVSDLAMLPYWFLILNSYARGGVTPGIGDVPPLLLYLAVIPIAAVIGWIGLHAGR